ncbi:uncharacterized protein LOC124264210 [Haliotis rubra]|uniref:uncharacterized protein LOC124264210 n=1 Tax=Haliotis rubra TaxID=36100 RepID=UPI001EE536A6|nr:uncharacterized protein LOC124264210 [Haliotis rubra]
MKSVCYYGTCRCVPGYSFNPGDDTCLRHCARYGNSMSSYPGLGITEHNLRAKKNTAMQECVKECVFEKNFLCVSADTYSNDESCNLQGVGYLEVHKRSRETGQTNWTYLHRDCAM